MAELLIGYLDRAASAPAPASACAFLVADWLIELGHADLAAPWRQLTPMRRLSRLRRAGGLEPIFAKHLDPLFARSEQPGRGDVGLVWAIGADGPEPVLTSAVAVAPGRWAARHAKGGLIVAAFPTHLAWSVQWPR